MTKLESAEIIIKHEGDWSGCHCYNKECCCADEDNYCLGNYEYPEMLQIAIKYKKENK